MIKFDEIVEDKEYRERVIKYFRLPMRLSISEEKFHSDLEFLKHVDRDKYTQVVEFTEHDFNKAVHEQGTDKPDFTMEHILEPILANFEANPRWQTFLEKDYSDVLDDYDGITNTHGFYVEENDGKHFVSIDLKAANWQSLQSIIGFDESYEEMIDEHTNNWIPRISKTFRTKITGVLGAKNIMDYNKKLLKDNKDYILQSLFQTTGVDLREQKPFAFYADEFLIEIDEEVKDKLNSLDLLSIEESVYKETGIKTHITPFTLKWLNINKGCVKLYKNNDYEILNISKDILLMIDKLSCDLTPSEIDFENTKLKKETKEEFITRLKEAIRLIDKSI